MSDEKPKRKIGDDPNPQLPPPPLSRARLAAKIEKVFEESLPSTKTPKKREEIRQAVEKTIKSSADGAKRLGRPRGEKPPKTLAERQQAFRDRKRGKKP